MVRRDAIKCIKFKHLSALNKFTYIWSHIEAELSEVDIDPLYDPVKKLFKHLHIRS